MNTYFDCAATTKPDPQVIKDITESMQNDWYNPSANYSNAKEIRLKLDHAREQIANYINCEPEEIYFTSGATEANNWIVYWNMLKNENITNIFSDKIEHPSIYNQLHPCGKIAECYVNMFPVSEIIGTINLIAVENMLKRASINKYFSSSLITISMVNNEIGTIQPIKQISDLIHNNNKFNQFHVDATQALTHMPIDVKELGIDAMSSSFHKYGGVKGVGFLYCKKDIELSPMLLGGHQENNMRAGTENVHYITAMGNHIERLSKTDKERWEKVKQLSKYLRNQLYNIDCPMPIYRNGEGLIGDASPYINSFTIIGISAKDLITLLDMDGIQISAGSACSSGENKPSRVLKALGFSDAEARNTIRISIDENNDKEGIDYLCNRLATHINFLKK